MLNSKCNNYIGKIDNGKRQEKTCIFQGKGWVTTITIENRRKCGNG